MAVIYRSYSPLVIFRLIYLEYHRKEENYWNGCFILLAITSLVQEIRLSSHYSRSDIIESEKSLLRRSSKKIITYVRNSTKI